MDLGYREESRLLAESLGRFLADRWSLALRHASAQGAAGHDEAVWAGLAELGVQGALLPEAAGGFGGTGEEIAVVFEAAGRALLSAPLLPVLMAGTALAEAGRADLLGPVIAGRSLPALAHDEPGGRYDGAVATAEAGGRLRGRKSVVPWGGEADLLVVSAQGAGGLGLFVVDPAGPGVSRRSTPTVDGLRTAEIAFEDAPAEKLAGEGAALLSAATEAGLLALSAEALGAMEAAADTTLTYLGTRKQFGQPIGAFQALQHRMADVLVDIEQMRSATLNAVAAFGNPEAPRALAAAKHLAGRTGRRVAEEAIQMHGGMGMTWEYPVGHFAKRLVMIDHSLGDAQHHLERFAALAAG